MKSQVAKKMLWIGAGLIATYIVCVLLSGAAWELGQCRGGSLIMNSSPGTEPPVTCASLPNGLGTVANGFVISAFSAVIFSPIWLGIWGLLVALPEISERNRLKREKD